MTILHHSGREKGRARTAIKQGGKGERKGQEMEREDEREKGREKKKGPGERGALHDVSGEGGRAAGVSTQTLRQLSPFPSSSSSSTL